MSAAPGRASAVGGGRPPPVGVGTAGRVVAGERVPARDLPAVLATALRRQPAQLTLDLARRSFVVTPHPGPAQIVLVPAGELAAQTLPLLSAALEAALGARPARVAIDLRHVRSIDGAGAHALVAAADRMGGWGGALTVCDPPPGVRRTTGGERPGRARAPVAAAHPSRPAPLPAC